MQAGSQKQKTACILDSFLMNIDQINIASYYELVLQPCSCWNLLSSIPAGKKLHSNDSLWAEPLRWRENPSVNDIDFVFGEWSVHYYYPTQRMRSEG